jgi:hypothetical protein
MFWKVTREKLNEAEINETNSKKLLHYEFFFVPKKADLREVACFSLNFVRLFVRISLSFLSSNCGDWIKDSLLTWILSL